MLECHVLVGVISSVVAIAASACLADETAAGREAAVELPHAMPSAFFDANDERKAFKGAFEPANGVRAADSRIGYESSNHYFFVPHFAENVVQYAP